MPAGALRRTDSIVFQALPGTPVTQFEATSGLHDVVGVRNGSFSQGLWLAAALASDLGVDAGDTVATTQGEASVAGVFEYPSDGRNQLLSYAAVSPTPAIGHFDQCWAEVWPSSADTSSLVGFAVDAQALAPDDSITAGQLNSRLGESYDIASKLNSRPTRLAGWVACAVGLALGALSVHIRRLELAAARHAGVRLRDLTAQLLCESMVWPIVGVVYITSVVCAVSWLIAPGSTTTIIIASVGIALSAAGSALVGALGATCLISEKRLFRLFKDR